ncbi:MAG: LysM peptidoglycan-binding domain-containing protein [Treponema sp.]|nr:LysM peptidoglycan-binding domain-containing protein [Treponema sp.]
MVVPSKFSLFGTKTAKKEAVKTEAAVTELPPEPSPAPDPKVSFAEPAPEPEPITAPEPLPPVPQSKVEEVVIIENAEDVVPLPPPVKPVKPKNINYKIKWGDTLWDISDTYYKNPWRYKYIARYNGIKNPDYIISGTYITIPAE